MRVAKITFCFASVPPSAARAAKQQDPGFEIPISNPGSARIPLTYKGPRAFVSQNMVEARGVEPLSENTSTQTSPGAGGYFGSPRFPRLQASRHA